MVEKAAEFLKNHTVAVVATVAVGLAVLFLGVNTIANGQKGPLKYLNGRTWAKAMCSCCADKVEDKVEDKVA